MRNGLRDYLSEEDFRELAFTFQYTLLTLTGCLQSYELRCIAAEMRGALEIGPMNYKPWRDSVERKLTDYEESTEPKTATDKVACLALRQILTWYPIFETEGIQVPMRLDRE